MHDTGGYIGQIHVPLAADTSAASAICMFDLDASLSFAAQLFDISGKDAVVQATDDHTIAHHELFSALVAMVGLSCVHDAVAKLLIFTKTYIC